MAEDLGSRSRSVRHGLLAGSLLLIVPQLLLCSCGDAGIPTPEEEHAAALRATGYLIDAAPTMNKVWLAVSFQRLYKIAPSDELARRLENILAEAIARPIAELPKRLNSPELLRANQLRPILIELWRRKMAGEPWREPAAEIAGLLGENEAKFWPAHEPTQQLVFLYLFQTLNIETARGTEDIALELHERWAAEDRAQLLYDIHFLYGVTHVVYVESGYGDRLLDPADYAEEIDILDTAIRRFAAELPADPTFIDVCFELLAARRFLQLPDSAETHALKARLLPLQDESGSWRPGDGANTLHATREAIHALGEFPTELRSLDPVPSPSH